MTVWAKSRSDIIGNLLLFVLRIQILDDFKNGATEHFIKESNKAIHKSTRFL